jgi:hypothetical protein
MNNQLKPANTTDLASQELVTLNPEAYATAVYEPFASRLKAAIALTDGVIYDVKTKEGMAVAKEHRALFRAIRIEGDKERAARKAPILAIGKLLESKYTALEAEIVPIEQRIDTEIKAEEARIEEEKAAKIRAEQEALAAIQNKIDAIKNKPLELLNATVLDIEMAINDLQATEPTTEAFGERNVEAEFAIKATIASLHTMADGKRAQAQLAAQIAAESERQAAQAAEENRVNGIKAKIQAIKNFIIEGSECDTTAQLNVLIKKLDSAEILESEYAEFHAEAVEAQAKALQVLHRQHVSLFAAEEAEKTRPATIEPSPVLTEVKPAEVTQIAPQPVTSKPAANDAPTVEMLVCIVAEGLKVDEMTAHKYLITADFSKYQKAA